jgi:hypothetical protein
VLAALGYVMLGMATGGVSVFLFPHPLIHPSRIHGISLLVSPVLTGLVMSRIGAALRRYGKHPTQIESFGYGFAFAFGMALVRGHHFCRPASRDVVVKITSRVPITLGTRVRTDRVSLSALA